MTSRSVVFDRAADYYDATRGFPSGEERPIADLIAQTGKLTVASRVLEIGIGTGRIGLPVAPHVQSYVGIDLSRAMMERLRVKQATEPVHLALADATRLPFAHSTFDSVIAVHVFHLIPNWRDALREVGRMLRPEGLLLHCFGDGRKPTDHMGMLNEIWQKTVAQEDENRPGLKWEQYETFLSEEGWQPQGPTQFHTYNEYQTPRQFLESRRQRLWSGTWHISDADLNHGLEALQAYIEVHFDNPDEPIETKTHFYVMPYLPPEA